jgi:hypothetical protein
VTVINAGDPEHAQPMAEQYCATLGKTAQFKGITRRHRGRHAEGIDVSYDCVARG